MGTWQRRAQEQPSSTTRAAPKPAVPEEAVGAEMSVQAPSNQLMESCEDVNANTAIRRVFCSAVYANHVL